MAKNDFGDRFRALRLKTRISLGDVAKEVGITTKTIGCIEKGQRGTQKSRSKAFAGMLSLCTDDDALSNS